MTDKKPLTFCIDWMRGRAEHTPMPASRATMESIVAYLEELEGLKETPDPKSDIQTAVCTGQNCPMQASAVDPANCACTETCRWATRPRTNGDVIRAMSDEELAGILARGDYLCGMDEACYGLTKDGCRKHAMAWLKREAP